VVLLKCHFDLVTLSFNPPSDCPELPEKKKRKKKKRKKEKRKKEKGSVWLENHPSHAPSPFPC
jgi:hypothetical protein